MEKHTNVGKIPCFQEKFKKQGQLDSQQNYIIG